MTSHKRASSRGEVPRKLSLWQLTGPQIESDVFDAHRRDVVVVGAGLTGLLTAVLLARAGLSVAVVESRNVGALTTGNTTGKLSLLQGTVFSDIRAHSGDEALQAYAEANREGQAWLLRQFETWGVSVDRRSAFTYAPEVAKLAALERELDAAITAGIDARETTETELPFDIAGALTLPDQAQLHPMVLLAELTHELHARGGVIIEQCPAREVNNREGEVEVITDLGTINADICVLATGIPILDRGMFFAKLEPSRSFAAAYRIPDSVIPQGMYLSIGTPRSLRTAQDAQGDEVLVVGGGSHVTGRGDGIEELQNIDQWTGREFPSSQRLTWWAAQDYRSHSRIPFAGPLPGGGGRIFTATGYNKWGMTNAVAAALTIAADVLGGHLEWAKALREHALRLPALRDALEVNATVAAKLATGWVAAETANTSNDSLPTEGAGIVVRDGVAPVGISRVDGRVCRVSAICTHLGGVLNWNDAEQSWDCPLHGSRFSSDGSRLEGPATHNLKKHSME